MKNTKKLKTLPVFKDEDEERVFWSTRDTSEYFDLDKVQEGAFPDLKPTTRKISIRLNESLLCELKMLAHKKNIPYQSLIKVYLSEKVREEII
jgi:predicted DNA binding CopG/RHH family protein